MKQLTVPIFAFFLLALVVFGQSHSKQRSDFAPAAIPIITEEEADRINAEIIEKKEPLFSFYEDSKLDKVSKLSLYDIC